jgi:hypothetical protein
MLGYAKLILKVALPKNLPLKVKKINPKLLGFGVLSYTR